jgi:hypothetical protein
MSYYYFYKFKINVGLYVEYDSKVGGQKCVITTPIEYYNDLNMVIYNPVTTE